MNDKFDTIVVGAGIAGLGVAAILAKEARHKILVQVPQEELKSIVRLGDWNEYRIRAQGDRIQLWLNGYQTVDWIETDPEMARRGLFGLQTHKGPPGEGWYRRIEVKDLTAAEK